MRISCLVLGLLATILMVPTLSGCKRDDKGSPAPEVGKTAVEVGA